MAGQSFGEALNQAMSANITQAAAYGPNIAKDCTTGIITYDYGIGTHSALFVDNSGNPILYDPGGSYLSVPVGQEIFSQDLRLT